MPSYKRKVDVPGKTQDELFEKVSKEIDRFLKKTPIGDFKIEPISQSKQIKVNSSMFSATLICLEGAIEIDAQLSLFAAPFKSKLDEGIDRWLAQTFKT